VGRSYHHARKPWGGRVTGDDEHAPVPVDAILAARQEPRRWRGSAETLRASEDVGPHRDRSRGGRLMQFEVEIYRNETGDWVATAVEHEVTVNGRTEQEALMRLLEALNQHFKKKPQGSRYA
jgi:predicted RNase H-like HicB family nuclease